LHAPLLTPWPSNSSSSDHGIAVGTIIEEVVVGEEKYKVYHQLEVAVVVEEIVVLEAAMVGDTILAVVAANATAMEAVTIDETGAGMTPMGEVGNDLGDTSGCKCSKNQLYVVPFFKILLC
jgi:hypothetical protein